MWTTLITTCSTLVYPCPLQTVKVAYLVMSDGIGFELFEFIDPPYCSPVSSLDNNPAALTPAMYARGGFFHIGLTVADIDATCASIISSGGHQIGETIRMGSDRTLYVKDPWGNVLELLTRSFVDVVTDNNSMKIA